MPRILGPHRWRPLLLAGGATLIAAVLLAGAFELWHRQSLAQWESRVQRSVSELRANIEAELYANLNLGTRMSAFVQNDPGLDETAFNAYAQNLLGSGQHALRYFAYAPGHVVRFIYPAAGQQGLIGLELERDPMLGREVAVLRRTRSLHLSGPYSPFPGTRTLIAHEPVVATGPAHGLPPVTGQIDIPIDLDHLFRRADVFRFAEQLDLAIRVIDSDPPETQLIFGRNDIFAGRPVTSEITLPGLELQLAGLPHGGWRAVEPVPPFIAPLAVLILATIFAAILRMSSQSRQLRESEAQMRATGSRLAALLAAMPNQVAILDRDGRCTALYGGRSTGRFHVIDAQIVGRTIEEILPADKARQLRTASQRALRDGRLQTIEFSISREEARAFADPDWPDAEQWFHTVIAPLANDGGDGGSTLWITDNVTETREAEIALQRSHNRYRQLTAAVQQVVFETDIEGRITYINPAWAKLVGNSDDRPLGMPWISLIHPDDREALNAAYIDLISGRCARIQRDTRLAGFADRQYWVSAYLMPLVGDTDARIRGAIGTLFDINERKRDESMIRHQALHDPLTSLPNRLLLIERLEQALARQRRQGAQLAVLFVDLDDFKSVNDHHGHLAGDQVLQQAGQRLREQMRDSDTVARIGGDEFVVLLESVSDPDGVHVVASKIVSAMGQHFELTTETGSAHCRIGASIGIAIAPRDGRTVDELLHQADLQLYQAKAAGKGVSRSNSG